MSVKLRLTRFGKKGNPFYRVIACDESAKRNGRFIEILGTYEPTKNSKYSFKNERVSYWLSKGATPSATVKSLLKKSKLI
jgi:small subunit ribosomal protein S16